MTHVWISFSEIKHRPCFNKYSKQDLRTKVTYVGLVRTGVTDTLACDAGVL